MSYYAQQISHPAASQTWFEAVHSEFLYEQSQISGMNMFSNQMLQSPDYRQPPNEGEMYYDPTAQIVPDAVGYMPMQPNGVPSVNYLNSSSMAAQQFPPNADQSYPLAGVAPCQGPRPWNFAQCFGFYGEPACPLLNVIDMEDFM